MKERILRDLHLLSLGQNEVLQQQILEELASEDKVIPDAEVPGLAKDALHKILHDYGSFSVSTIDSFFQRIVRSFSKELRLPMRYEVQLDSGAALDEVISRIMEKINKASEEELSKWLENFAFESIDDDKGWNIERAMRNLGGQLFEENINQLIELQRANADALSFEKLGEYIQIFKALRRDFVKTLDKMGEDATKVVESNGLSWKDFTRGANSFFPKLQKKDYAYGATVQKCYEDVNSWVTKKNPRRDELIKFAERHLQDRLIKAVDYIDEYLPTYNTCRAVLNQIHTYGLLIRMKQELSVMRKDNNNLLISDTTPLLRDLVHEQDAPFVLEKVGTQFNHIMIDEFQDTSSYQWEAMRPLVLNVLANPYHHALFVGDVKQSIYRWRGGDMRLLLENLNKDLLHHSTEDSNKVLNTNYRSDYNIVAFNNAFFKHAPAYLASRIEQVEDNERIHDLAKCYEQVEQGIVKDAGYVQVDILGSADTTDAEEDNLDDNDHIIKIIREAQIDGYALSDIAIIIRKNNWGILIADYLKKHGIPVISSQSLMLQHSVEVRMLINIFRFLQDGSNKIAQGAILHYARLIENPTDGGADDQDFNSLNKKEKQSLFEDKFPFLYDEERNQILRKPLYEMTETLIRKTGLKEKLDVYLQSFLDILHQRGSEQAMDLHDFLDWWDEQGNKDKQYIKSPDSSNAVRVTTIHKSKGLEYPIVILPYTEWKIYPGGFKQTIIWAKTTYQYFHELNPFPVKYVKDLHQSGYKEDYQNEKLAFNLDMLNELYVAFTRAKNRLYILASAVKPAKTEITNAAQLLVDVLSDFEHKHLFDANAGRFAMGEKIKKPGDAPKPSSAELGFTQASNYEQKLQVKQQSDDFFLLTDDPGSTAIRRGTKIHRIFELLEAPGYLKAAINRVHSEGLLLDSEVQSLHDEIETILQIPQIKDWFEGDWEVLNEREMYKDNQLLRPDRVMIKKQLAAVVDYKTGQRNDNKYKKQLDKYGDLLLEMGYQVEKYVFYIDQKEVVQI